MGVQSSLNLIACFIFVAVSLAFLKQWRRIKTSNNGQKLLPGPWKLPLIGNLHNLIGSLQHHVLNDLARKHGPLFHLKLGEIDAIVASSPRLAKEIMKTQDISFADRPEVLVWSVITYNRLGFTFGHYGEYWRQTRRICMQELFSPKKVRAFKAIREEEFSHMTANILRSDGTEIDLTANMSTSTVRIISRATLGKVCRDHDKLVHVTKEVFRLGSGFSLVDMFPSYKILHVIMGTKRKMMKLRQKLDLVFDEVINEHIEQSDVTKRAKFEAGVEDVTDVLLRLKESGDLKVPLGYDNIKAILLDIFAGAIETSSTAVEWTMAELMKNPHVMTKAQNEIRQAFKGKKKIEEDDIQGLKYLGFVIKETLRLHPPGPMLVPRECREECELDGYKIAAGTKVFINAWALARDPEYWDDAESFVPERFESNSIDFSGHNFEFLPFGAGRRMCPGSLFGLANVELPLAILLYYFDWKLPNGANYKDLDMTEAPGLATPRKNHLWLVPSRYDPLCG